MPRKPIAYPIGDVLPGTNYVVRRKLGEGGMGFVLEVVQDPGIEAVIKMIRPELQSRPETVSRFFEEVRILAKLRHPNIVQVTGCGKLTDGTPYYAMELLTGKTLRQLMRDAGDTGAIESVIAYEIMRGVLEGLFHAHAHSPNVVHRDIKPENIFLHAPDVGPPSVKLIDFGVALTKAHASSNDKGKIIGTPRYMAPEQLRGEPVTPKADLYAAGLVLYEMLAGRGPFDELNTDERIRRAHHKLMAPSISEFAPWVPDSVQSLLASVLAFDPDDRPDSAYAFYSKLFELQFASGGQVVNTTAPTLSTLLASVTRRPSSEVLATPDAASTDPRMAIPRIEGASLEPAPLVFNNVRTLSDDAHRQERVRKTIEQTSAADVPRASASRGTKTERTDPLFRSHAFDVPAVAPEDARELSRISPASSMQSVPGTARSLPELRPARRTRGVTIGAAIVASVALVAITISGVRRAETRIASAAAVVGVTLPAMGVASAVAGSIASAPASDAPAPSASVAAVTENAMSPPVPGAIAVVAPATRTTAARTGSLPVGHSSLLPQSIDDEYAPSLSPTPPPPPRPQSSAKRNTSTQPAGKPPVDDGANLLLEAP